MQPSRSDPLQPPGAVAWSWSLGLLSALLLGVLHIGLGCLPDAPFSPPINLVLYFTNLYVLYAAAVTLRRRSAGWVALFVTGYSALAALILFALGKKPLFILLIIAYASLFGSPLLLAYFVLFVLCFVLFQPYSFETFVPLALIVALLWRTRKTASWFERACLGGGLLALLAVLFPLLHLASRDSMQTVFRTLARPEVMEAVGLSLASSTVATIVVALWGVPLAYALARMDFPGKRWVEAFVDVPILVPQSVAGVAFMVLLGPGGPLGQALEGIGIRVSGSMTGIVLAQVFVASPFLIKTSLTAFEAVPRSLERASRSLGASPALTFARISLPLASRGIWLGAALAWARAVSEFGCIVLFASSPVTAPVLVHTEFLRAGATESRPIAVVLLIICLWIFVLMQSGQSLLPTAFRSSPRPRRA